MNEQGLLTGVIGIISYFYVPPSPTQTKSKFRGKDGWFNEHEEKIMVNRVLRDDPSKGDMHNRQAVSLSMFWECLKDYHLWPVYLIGLSWLLPTIPMASVSQLAPLLMTFETYSFSVPHPHTQGCRVRNLYDQSPHYPGVRALHYIPACRILALRASERAFPHWHNLAMVVFTATHRP